MAMRSLPEVKRVSVTGSSSRFGLKVPGGADFSGTAGRPDLAKPSNRMGAAET
jgi:hypothetical protein